MCPVWSVNVSTGCLYHRAFVTNCVWQRSKWYMDWRHRTYLNCVNTLTTRLELGRPLVMTSKFREPERSSVKGHLLLNRRQNIPRNAVAHDSRWVVDATYTLWRIWCFVVFNRLRCRKHTIYHCSSKKVTVRPYSLPSVELEADPGIQAVRPQVTF